MCGVVGFVGCKSVQKTVLAGLSALEYRGYDSTGFACINKESKLQIKKVVGSLHNLIQVLNSETIDGMIGIGHTRWATHGMANLENAHPHIDCTESIAVVHNGIIENHQDIKKKLEQKGHIFSSESDSEVIVHLAETLIRSGLSAKVVLQKMSETLQGTYAYVILSEQFSNQLLIARNRSPLCLAIGKDGIFVASDPLAFPEQVDKMLFLPDKSYAVVTCNEYKIFDFAGNLLDVPIQKADKLVGVSGKGDYEHYMLKEIYEQKQAILRTLYEYKSGQTIQERLGLSTQVIKDLEEITIVGCGTSFHAGLIGQFFLESIAQVSTTVQLGSEFRHKTFLPREKSICIAISQSGQTADTLEAVEMIKQHKVPVIALTNVAQSSLVRESNGLLVTQAGPEIAVASTKAFSTQVATLYWLAHQIALVKGLIDNTSILQAEQDLEAVANMVEANIAVHKDAIVADLDLYVSFKNYIFLGRHVTYPFALEAALKLKEISYIFSQAYSAGELKHGPLALVDVTVPVILFSHTDESVYKKIVANAQEVKARKGFLIVFACKGQNELLELADKSFIMQTGPALLSSLAMTGVMQFFCYILAKKLGRSIDKPRNLAKSVTVE
jgi:glutamine---fructose-6-phosphate transaminase (isomerizing)